MGTRVELLDGKYTVLHENGSNLRALRNGLEWRDLVGDNLILAMADRIEDLELQVDSLKLKLAVVKEVL